MKDLNNSYEYLLNEFGEKKLSDRICLLSENANYFIKSLELNDFIYISLPLLNKSVLDYFADIARLKEFHNIEATQPTKVASYTCYWINKRKPLQLKENVNYDIIFKQPTIEYVNELFALFILKSMAFEYNSEFNLVCKELEDWNILMHYLRYSLTYRIMTAQSLELILIALNINSKYPSITQSQQNEKNIVD